MNKTEYILKHEDYVILETKGNFEVVGNGQFLFEAFTLEDAKSKILLQMKRSNNFANVYLQKEDGTPLEKIIIEYSWWDDSSLTIGEKYEISYDILIKKGYRIQINPYLPYVSIDRYRIYDGAIYKEDIFFTQDEEAVALLESVPSDVSMEHWILYEIVG